jgi:post-segregation antitoxin (ccd killing protein)
MLGSMSPYVSLGKKSVMIYLPTHLVHESRGHGLNISRISQNALKDIVSKLDGTTEPRKVWRARRELNPGPPGLLRTGKSLTEYASPVLYLFRTLIDRI